LEHTINCVLSTEVIPLALIVGITLITFSLQGAWHLKILNNGENQNEDRSNYRNGKTISQHFGRAPYYLLLRLMRQIVSREMREKLGSFSIRKPASPEEVPGQPHAWMLLRT